jgi:ribose transport system substrate-binding protein
VNKTLSRLTAVAALFSVATLVTAGCSSSKLAGSSGKTAGKATVSVDVGNAKIKLTKGPLHIALLMNGRTNAWQAEVVRSATAQAHSVGATLTVFDAAYDLQQQLNQIRTVASGGKYDAVIATPVDGTQECNALTKTLPAANVLVSVFAQPVCGREAKSGDGLWAPGTLNFVGGDSGFAHATQEIAAAAKLNPGPQKVVFVVGPQLAPSPRVEVAAAKAFSAAHPDFHIVDYVYTDWTTPGGYSAMLAYLKAHANITVVVSDYGPDLTRGVLNALKAAGKTSVSVIDAGASKEMVALIPSGEIQASIPIFPTEHGKSTIDSLIKAQSGAAPARFISNIPAKWGTVDNRVVITKDNLSEYTPQF